ncbi:MAG: hypothetical protein ACSLE2_16790 [Lysobacterales bacterium]
MTAEGTNPLKLIVTLAIDYARWTQLSPLVTLWAFGIGMLAAMLFVNYQVQSWDALGSLFQWIAGLPLIGDRFSSWLESLAGEEETIRLGGNDLKSAVLKAWSLLSLAFMVLALAINWIFGPFKPWSLKRKLGIAALCCMTLLAGFVAVYLADPEQFNGPASSWMFNFGGIAFLLFVVNAWCLTIAHLLGLGRRAIEYSSLGERDRSKPLPASDRS